MMQKPLVAIVTVRCQCNTNELIELLEKLQHLINKANMPSADLQIGLSADARERLLRKIIGGT